MTRSSVLGDVYEERGDRVYVGEFKYRIPSFIEAEEHFIDQEMIGCWKLDVVQNLVVETNIQSQTWEKLKQRVYNEICTSVTFLDYDDYDHAINSFINGVSEHFPPVRNCNLNYVFTLEISYFVSDLTAGFELVDRSYALYHDFYNEICIFFDTYPFNFQNLIELVDGRNCERSDRYEAVRFALAKLLAGHCLLLDDYERAGRAMNSSMQISHLSLQLLNRVSAMFSELLQTHPREQLANLKAFVESRKNQILMLYTLFILLDERQEGRIPAWEAIRIARERVTI